MPVSTRLRSKSRGRRKAAAPRENDAPDIMEEPTLASLQKQMAAQSSALSSIAEQLAQLNQNLVHGVVSASAPAPAPTKVTHGPKDIVGPSRGKKIRSAKRKRRGEPRQVYCRFTWFQLDSIDLVKHTFHCKGYFEATWHAPELKGVKHIDWNDPEIFSPQIVFANKANDLTHDFAKFVINKKATELFGGQVMASYQTVFHGDFTTEYCLQKFPYDEQVFKIIIGSGHTDDNVVFTPNPHITSVAPGIDKFSLNDTWSLVLKDGKDGMRILPSVKGVMGNRSRCGTIIMARRRPQFYEVNTLLMNFIIVLLCFCMFRLPVTDVADRMNIAMTAMLTSVAFKTYVADQLPDLSYLTFLDKYLLSGILLLVVMVIETVFIHSLFEGDQKKIEELDQQFCLALIVLFVVGNIVAFNERLASCCRCLRIESSETSVSVEKVRKLD